MSYIDSPAFWHIEFGCQSSIEHRARYAITVTCATIVFHAQQICHSPQQNRTMLPLCRSTCELFSDSVQSIVNSALLEDDCSQEIFSKNYEQLEEHCGSNDNMSRLSPSGCISGSDFEPDLCGRLPYYLYICVLSIDSHLGFGDNKDALCYYCNTQDPMLPCCQEQHCIKSDSTVPVIAIVLGSVDYTEISPDIPIDYEVEGVKEHVFKVDSLGQQFVRVNHSREAPQKPDELELIQNDIIRMYCYFDDGWGLGKVMLK
ncbi:uncharacterized protein B0P05DRAFT_473818 [Gilbertella persicaria]|uniref:uncharacterized protein n=1 Tax=Gilbertella persicaria TaxID=101096 RepID=UPI00221EC067|nr:uncharacterized protein B0P05DRAFT_473818 [Gilbertella persicaria]KAI8072133.1 hypothetical protein B0P05DRAFT_473818 [Gilbertella persicaria]